ncbi:hypothetical protein PJ985_00490 [Streptomyces sp. ACA25]|nr:hypothetical protein [Streptomyces sp. ACA25]MDB1086060.1 hypothetical protein [Streptomyces sp. ACA25]
MTRAQGGTRTGAPGMSNATMVIFAIAILLAAIIALRTFRK